MREKYITIYLTEYEAGALLNVLKNEIGMCRKEEDETEGIFKKHRRNDAEFFERIGNQIFAGVQSAKIDPYPLER